MKRFLVYENPRTKPRNVAPIRRVQLPVVKRIVIKPGMFKKSAARNAPGPKIKLKRVAAPSATKHAGRPGKQWSAIRKPTKSVRKAGRKRSALRVSRGAPANHKEKNMAKTAYQRHVAAFARSHKGMKGKALIEAAAASWRSSGKKKSGGATKKARGGKKAVGRKARRGRGFPLTGKSFRPHLPKGPNSAVAAAASRSFKASVAEAVMRGIMKKKTGQKLVSTNRGKLSSGKARAMALRRWADANPITTFYNSEGRKKKRARRNFGFSSVIDRIKGALKLDSAKPVGATLFGAIVAAGAPSLLPSLNTGWSGVGLSFVSALLAAGVVGAIKPDLTLNVLTGGTTVIGLRLAAQFVPKALNWGSAVAGFLPVNVARVSGYLPAPPGARSVSGRPLQGMGALMKAGGENFRSNKWA